MKGYPTGRASVESLLAAPRTSAPVPDDPALAGKPRARDIINAQIVQSIIQRGIE